jgi:V8-like Glu-specific endopeptidase
MNKKYILCIFVVLIIITNSSYAFPAISKPMNNKRANMVPMSKTFDIPPEKRTSNTTEPSADVDEVSNLDAVGLLNIVKTDGSDDDCTGTVIRTDNGNIAITAAHCLWDHNLKTWNAEIYFFPGYNNGNQGKVGKVTGAKWYVWSNFMEDITQFDYGFIKFDYPNGKKLQDDTGAFDYDLVIPEGIYPTSVFGYPSDGGMDCPKDGQHQCEWEGLSDDIPKSTWYRGVNIDVGFGSSGGPWIRNYDPNAKTGNVMGVSHGILPEPFPDTETASWIWYPDDFTRLLYYAEHD